MNEYHALIINEAHRWMDEMVRIELEHKASTEAANRAFAELDATVWTLGLIARMERAEK